ncbi:hypothetical protein GOP47_0027908 [Adiantum capillus-veneris]|nr:hypothetical protein GOP47_0027908 [Adiantum capillus-veneris]
MAMYVGGCGNAAFCKLPAALSSPMDMYIINGFQRPPKKTMAKEVSSQALPSSPFPLLPSSHRHRLFTLSSSPLLLSLLPLSSSTHPLLSKTSLSPHLQARVSSITYPLLFSSGRPRLLLRLLLLLRCWIVSLNCTPAMVDSPD